MRPEFFPISYWLDFHPPVYVPSVDSYVDLRFALANEENQ